MASAVSPELDDEIRRFVMQPDGSGQCPYEAFAALRAIAPLYRTQDGVWIITGHEAYTKLLRDPRISRQEAARSEFGDPAGCPAHVREAIESFPDMMINQDGASHARIRRLVRTAFLPAYVESWRPRIAQIAREVVDHASTLDVFDFVEEVGYPLPERVMTELIGVPEGDRSIWAGWSRAITRYSRAKGGQSADITGVQEAMAKFYAYMRDTVRARRASGDYAGNDMLAVLIRAEEESDRLCVGR